MWLEQVALETGRTEGALDSRPEVPDDLVWVWNAFWTLSGSRSAGFGLNPIPISEILAYCDLLGHDSLENRYMLLRIVKLLDAHYLEKKYQGSQSPGKVTH